MAPRKSRDNADKCLRIGEGNLPLRLIGGSHHDHQMGKFKRSSCLMGFSITALFRRQIWSSQQQQITLALASSSPRQRVAGQPMADALLEHLCTAS